MAVLARADHTYAQATQTTPDKNLYERLGGVFAIAAVVDHFSDSVVKNPIVGQKSKNPRLREWHTKNLKRLPGLKFMRTLWVCNVSGGPSSSRHLVALRDLALFSSTARHVRVAYAHRYGAAGHFINHNVRQHKACE